MNNRSLPIQFTYTPALDGMRAIAVLSVMVYHSAMFFPSGEQLTGGFLGVDIFFVLSGFLITSVLLNEYGKDGSISLTKFYIRRVLRLVPAFWLFLLVLFIMGRWLLVPEQAEIIYQNNRFLIALTYLTNWASAYGPHAGHLNHAWSLAIEEQFYILWPTFLWIAIRRNWSPKSIVRILAVLIFVVIAFRAHRASIGTSIETLSIRRKAGSTRC